MECVQSAKDLVVVVPEFQFQFKLLIALISDTLMLISSARVVSVFNMIEL
jgi:hypothetical protein